MATLLLHFLTLSFLSSMSQESTGEELMTLGHSNSLVLRNSCVEDCPLHCFPPRGSESFMRSRIIAKTFTFCKELLGTDWDRLKLPDIPCSELTHVHLHEGVLLVFRPYIRGRIDY